MPVNRHAYEKLIKDLLPFGAGLVAVSKKKTVAEIRELYESGQRDFGENYVQELLAKQKELPADIRWHFIGHLQSNKVKSIVPFVHLIHSIDSISLLTEINKQAEKNNRVVDCLLQIYIATEETKFGLSTEEAEDFLLGSDLPRLKNILLKGVMGMASLTENEALVRSEFRRLKEFFKKTAERKLPGTNFQYLSMGMTNDYLVALQEGSNLVRIGSAIFGER